jgi:TolA-binding protein
LYRLARLMRLQESWARAAYMYRRMISNYPDHAWVPRALFDTGLCHQYLKKPEQAAESWQQLLEEYPEHELVEETRYRLGLLLAAAGDRKAARNQFEQLLEDYPKTAYLAQARYYLGVLLAGEEQWANAEEQFRKALDEELGEELTGRARFQLADVLRRQEQDQEAADLVQSMLGTDAQKLLSPEYLNWLALYRFEEQDGPSTVEAAEAMLKVASTPEQQQVAALLAGQGLEMEEKSEAALVMYRKAAELSARPRSSGEAALRWGDVALLLEQPDQAREAYERAAAVAENDSLMDVRAKAYLGLGKVAQQQEAWEDAARYLLSVGILYEDETIVPEALYRAATVLDADGLTDDAQKTRAELLEKYPDSEWAERTTAGTRPADNLPGEEPK